MVSSIKQKLEAAIANLSEEDCVQVMTFVQNLQYKDAQSLSKLAADPTFVVPSHPISFQSVQPISSTGISASEQLLEDRR